MIIVPDGYLEILSFGTYLPDESLKLRVISNPTSSNFTSSGDSFCPWKMFHSGHVQIFPNEI
jgi:hypothetical protein